ncbi:pirin family protein [Mucilaginibacter kameinonensis]|uniref:pirin family protein n=1 Tax=Mucilaginibacter kameinonensis TaxID=452286 RepID=UPI000EF76AFA|nr:pirin family protein [Mucilaginibacter kameinonensis]
METINFLPASTRGNKNIGWLNGFHSFSFGTFYEATRASFGPLLMLNDDFVKPNTGFGQHPHKNMEIISIPLKGTITHKDSTGREATIGTGDIQVMSAGTGITHSEFNNGNEDANFLQIWIHPEQRDVNPRYQQISIPPSQNQLRQVVSPYPDDEGLWVYQRVWIHLGNFEAGASAACNIKHQGDGVYIFLISGEAWIGGYTLQKRDAITVTGLENILIRFTENSRILVIEVPVK